MAERSYRKLFWGLAVAGLVLDQVTKYGVFRWLYNAGQGDQREVVPGAFDLLTRFTREPGANPLRTWGGEMMPEVNHGALFGFLGQHVGLANALFAVISLAAGVAIVWWSSRPAARQERGLSAALGLILAGTLGNLFDRLVFGGVRDFLHLHYQSFDWPVFNVADCCLVLGAFLLLGQAFFGKATAESPATAPAAPQEMAEAADSKYDKLQAHGIAARGPVSFPASRVAPMLVPYNVDVPMARVPFANWLLIGVTCVISIVIMIRFDPDRDDFSDLERELQHALQNNDQKEVERVLREMEKREEQAEQAIPPLSLRWSPLAPVWAFTYQFVHADPLHLIGNMIFLFCFGNAVNAKLGHWQFLVAYLLLGALAGLAFLPFSHGLPLVGASGSIMGIVGLFVVLFPRNDVQVFYWFGLIWAGVTRISAYWVVLFFVICDLIGAVLDHSGPVAYIAHLVGALAGFALGIALVQLRFVRSTRYEENLLEFLGYQRKGESRRRKKKKAKRRPTPETVAELLADGSDLDICQGVFRLVLRRSDGEVNVVGLTAEERVVVLVWYSVRVIEKGGFRALFEDPIPGDRRWARTVEAYHTIGCTRAGNVLRKAAARQAGDDTGEYADERMGRSLKELARIPAAEERQFLEVIDDVEPNLAEYVRGHREFFLTLDDDEE